MSSCGKVYLERFDYDKKHWILCPVYDYKKHKKYDQETGKVISEKEVLEPLILWEGLGELRDILSPHGFNYDFRDYSSVASWDKDDIRCMSDEMVERFENYDREEEFRTATLAQLIQYYHDYPLVDSEDEIYDIEKDEYRLEKIDNPIKEIIDRIYMIIDMKDIWTWNHSELNDFRIVFWIA